MANVSGRAPFDEACASAWRHVRETFSDRHSMPPGPTAVTLELCGVRDVSHELAAYDAQTIVDYLTHAGLIGGDVPESPPLRAPATPLAGCDYMHAPVSGVILHRREIGERMRAGEVIARDFGSVPGPLDAARCADRTACSTRGTGRASQRRECWSRALRARVCDAAATC